MIGRDVLYYRWDQSDPLIPRAGKINGMGSRPGYVSVTVFSDYGLDHINHSMPIVQAQSDVALAQAIPTGPDMNRHICVLLA